MNAPLSAAGIAERVMNTINSRDRGDVRRASSRLGVPAGELDGLDRMLAVELSDDRSQDRALRLLAAVTRCYQTDPCWLLTGHCDLRGAGLTAAERLRVADILLRLGDVLVRDRAAHRLLRAQPWSRAG